jgi:hypothetical protein
VLYVGIQVLKPNTGAVRRKYSGPVSLAVTHQTRVREMLGSNLGQDIVYSDQVRRSFLQSRQTNAGIALS